MNVHRVVITAVLLAAKFFDDAYYNNAYYAKVGGVLVEEMNNLETQFLFKIDFSLRVLPEVFEKYNAELVMHSTAMGLERIAHSTDEELFNAPQPQVESMGMCHQSVAAEAAPQAPLLHTYSQPELEYSFVYPTPMPAPPQEESVASHYSISVLQQQQQQHGTALDPVYPYLAPPADAHHHQASSPPDQEPAKLDMLNTYTMPAAAASQDATFVQYTPPVQVLYNNLLQSQVSDTDPVYSSQAVPIDESYSHYCPIQVTTSGSQAPCYSHHTGYMDNGVIQSTMHQMVHNHHHHYYPEITPSPPPHHRPMNIHGAPLAYHNSDIGCSINPLHRLPYLKSSSSTSSASVAASMLRGHYYATPADAALAMHHQQHLLPSRPIAIGNHVSHDNCWSASSSSGPA